MKKLLSTFAILVAASTIFVSCDKDYDFNNLDTQVQIGKNLYMPIPAMTASFKLSDVAKFEIGMQQVTAKALSFNLPALTKAYITAMPDELTFPVSSNNTMTVKQEDFPSFVSSIDEVTGTYSYTVDFNFSSVSGNSAASKIYLMAGFTVSYPSWIHVVSCSDPSFTIDSKGTVITLSKDLAITRGTPFSLTVSCDKIIVPSDQMQVATPGTFKLTGSLNFSGSLAIKKTDVTQTSAATTPTVSMDGNLNNFSMQSVTAVLDASAFDYSFTSDALLDDMEGIGIKKVQLSSKVSNTTALGFSINASFVDDSSIKISPFDIAAGAKDVDTDITISSDKSFEKLGKMKMNFKLKENKNKITINMSDEVSLKIISLYLEDGFTASLD